MSNRPHTSRAVVAAPFRGGRGGRVSDQQSALDAVGVQEIGGSLSALPIRFHEDDPRSFSPHLRGSGKPDAGSSACDDCHAIFEAPHGCSQPLWGLTSSGLLYGLTWHSVNRAPTSERVYTCYVKADRSPSILRCPLCASGGAALLFTSVRKNLERDYVLCDACDLVFVPREFHLDEDAARARYLLHDNDPCDGDYRRFLARLWDEMRPRLRHGARGLDYGAGPGPALSAMIEEDGFSASIYDPIFHPGRVRAVESVRLHHLYGDGGAFRCAAR